MTHCVDGHGVCGKFQTSPPDRYLASPDVQCKSNAASSFPASTSHVVLFCQSSDRASAVSQLVTHLLPGTRLTVLSGPSDCGQVLEGATRQQSHDVLLSGPVLTALGITSTVQSSPHCYSSGLPLFRCFVRTGCLSVKQKPLPATSFDSFVQLNTSQTVNGPDLSSTCIEFEGILAGRPVRILLDSGASANCIDNELVQELALPTASLSSHVAIRVADGRTSIVESSVAIDLTVGSLDFGVTCLPTELAYYDLVLGKPWLTVFNPVVIGS
eukprot:jgi/Botrbrau1/20570/Bobra.145_2s0117.1